MAFVAMGLHQWTRQGISLLQDAARQRGIHTTLTSGFRSNSDQARLIASGKGITPAAPGRSTHNYGFAFDIVTTDPSRQTELGLLGEQLGLTWGGRFRDPVHFQIVTTSWWRAALRQVFG